MNMLPDTGLSQTKNFIIIPALITILAYRTIMLCISSVSYTHLDVYKRQNQCAPIFSTFITILAYLLVIHFPCPLQLFFHLLTQALRLQHFYIRRTILCKLLHRPLIWLYSNRHMHLIFIRKYYFLPEHIDHIRDHRLHDPEMCRRDSVICPKTNGLCIPVCSII